MNKQRKDVNIKVPIADTINVEALKPDVYVTVRVALYNRMYDIAMEHKDLAKRYAGKEGKVEIKESMISILFAYTYLEAYINAIGIDHLGTEWQKPKYKKASTVDKWKDVSRILSSNQPESRYTVFCKNKEPMKSLVKLKTIRDEHLVHWKAQAHEPVLNDGNLVDIIIATFNYKDAEWACDTAKQMVTKLNENMKEHPDAE